MPSPPSPGVAASDRTHVYRRRTPERSVLYRLVQSHLATWIGLREEGDAVPAHVERELRRYLECGILAHGFARAYCEACGHDFLVAFSCKGRGVCPSCTAKRMSLTAAHLTCSVIPPLPVRQWVLFIPKRLRYFPAPRPGWAHARPYRHDCPCRPTRRTSRHSHVQCSTPVSTVINHR